MSEWVSIKMQTSIVFRLIVLSLNRFGGSIVPLTLICVKFYSIWVSHLFIKCVNSLMTHGCTLEPLGVWANPTDFQTGKFNSCIILCVIFTKLLNCRYILPWLMWRQDIFNFYLIDKQNVFGRGYYHVRGHPAIYCSDMGLFYKFPDTYTANNTRATT